MRVLYPIRPRGFLINCKNLRRYCQCKMTIVKVYLIVNVFVKCKAFDFVEIHAYA